MLIRSRHCVLLFPPKKDSRSFFQGGPSQQRGVQWQDIKEWKLIPEEPQRIPEEPQRIPEEILQPSRTETPEQNLNICYQKNCTITLSDCIANMGIKPMQVQHNLAGKLECFQGNWSLLTKDWWVRQYRVTSWSLWQSHSNASNPIPYITTRSRPG